MTGITKSFLNASDIEDGIKDIVEMSRGKGVSPVLAGGCAMQLYGSSRLTKDVDFLARAVPKGFDVERKLSFGGVSGKTKRGVPVCLIIRDDDFKRLYVEAHKEARAVAGVSVKVVSPEYLVAMKMEAGRPKDEEDLRTLVLSKFIDLDKAREIIRRVLGGPYAVKSFNSFVDEAIWRRSRDK